MVRGSDRMQVAVLMGGPSSEHDISLLGGKNVVDALDLRRYDVRPVVILRNGAWQVAARPWRGAEGGFDPHAGSGWRSFEGTCEALAHLRSLHVAAVLPILHGRFGEDGTLQCCLQAAGLPYVGSNGRASATAADKIRTKEVLGFHRVATPRFEVLAREDLRSGLSAVSERLVQSFGLPLVIKDPLGGSSLEVRLCEDVGQVAAALDALGPNAERLMAEAFVRGRELTVGVLGLREGEPPLALPVIEIRPTKSKTFDYAEKYAADGAQELCPAPLEPALARQAQDLALRVHGLLGLRALSRTDLMLAEDGSLQVLETNTLPGMTQRSLVPRAAAAAQITFPALVEGLLRTAAL
ncbi:MAG: ATP-grasp domain-containing protein [Planctomycetia bacterium]